MYAHTTAGIGSSGGGGAAYDPTDTVAFPASGTYAMDAKLLSHMAIKPDVALAVVSVGVSGVLSTELIANEDCDVDEYSTFTIGRRFEIPTTLYITVSNPVTIIFYKF